MGARAQWGNLPTPIPCAVCPHLATGTKWLRRTHCLSSFGPGHWQLWSRPWSRLGVSAAHNGQPMWTPACRWHEEGASGSNNTHVPSTKVRLFTQDAVTSSSWGWGWAALADTLACLLETLSFMTGHLFISWVELLIWLFTREAYGHQICFPALLKPLRRWDIKPQIALSRLWISYLRCLDKKQLGVGGGNLGYILAYLHMYIEVLGYGAQV